MKKIALVPQSLAAVLVSAAVTFTFVSVSAQGVPDQQSGQHRDREGPLARGPLVGAGPLQGANPLQGSGPLMEAGPLQGDTPIIGGAPMGAGGPITDFGGEPPASPLQLASLPGVPNVLPRDLADPGVPLLPITGPSGGPSVPGDPGAPPDQPATDCVTCDFMSPPTPSPTPPPNNIVNCANVTCS